MPRSFLGSTSDPSLGRGPRPSRRTVRRARRRSIQQSGQTLRGTGVRTQPTRGRAPLARATGELSSLIQRSESLLANPPSDLRGGANLLGVERGTEEGKKWASELEALARKIAAQTDRVERKASKQQRTGKTTLPGLGGPQAPRLGPVPVLGPDPAKQEKRRQVRGAKQQRIVRAGRGVADRLEQEASEARKPDTSTINALLTASAGLPVGAAGGIGGRVLGAAIPRLAKAGAGTAGRGAAKGIAQGARAVAKRTPAPVRSAAAATGRGAKRGWASPPARVARRGTRVGTAPVRVPAKYAYQHPGQSFLASNAGLGAIAASGSGKPEDLLLGPARLATTTAKTTFEHPGDVAGTTARAIPSMATALAMLPADLALAATKGETEPLEGFAGSVVDYYDQIASVAKDEPYTYTDPKTGEKVEMSPEDVVRENLGLIPVISGGLVGARALRGRSLPTPVKERVTPSGRVERKSRNLREDLSSPDFATRKRAEEKIAKLKAPVRERLGQKVKEGRRAAATGDRINARWGHEMMREKRKGRPDVRLDKQLEELSQRKLATVADEQGKRVDVSVGDAVQFLGREGLTTPGQVRARVVALKSEDGFKEMTREIGPAGVSTRNVVDALEQNPKIVSDPALRDFMGGWAEMQRQRSVERHSARTGKSQTTPDPEDIRAQRMAQARAEGVLLEDERIPIELRGETKIRPRSGHVAETQIKGEAKSLRKRAARFDAQAKALNRSRPDRADALKVKAAGLRQQADRLESVVGRKSRAAGLERQAVKAENSGDAAGAAGLRQQAQALRREDLESQARTRDEFVTEAELAQKRAGKDEPIFFRESDVADRGGLNISAQFSQGKLPPKEKRKMGKLMEQGRIDEAAGTLLENAYRGRVEAEMRTHVEDFGKANFIDAEGQIHTGPEWRRLQREGKVPPGTALVPVQEFNRALQRGAWDEAAGLMDDALRREVREQKFREGRKFAAVPEASLKEFRGQMEQWANGLRYARAVGRAQSLAMLALSPAWFGFQLIASPIAAVVAHPNPASWAKAVRTYYSEWRNLPPEQRISFQSHYGGTTADAISGTRHQIGLRPDTVNNMASAAGIALRSPIGRVGHAIWRQVETGGPLIRANRVYEAKVRDLVALIESDKQIRSADRAMRFGGNVAGLHETVARHLAALRGKPLSQQVRFYNENPKATADLGRRMADTLGDWMSLTKAERAAAAVTVFYPFLRFSMRWLFHAMPRNHPLTTAVLLNLSQMNAEEYERLIGGAPSFFPDWGNVVVHDGPDGQPTAAMDLRRAAPGSNAILESMAQGGFNLPTLFAPFQPVVKTLATAAAGQDPFTGRESKRSKGELLVRGIVGLPPPLRPVAHRIGAKSPYAKLFEEITGKQGSPGEYLAPNPIKNLETEREAQRVSHLMSVAFGSDDTDEAQDAREELDRYFEKYGIDHSATGASSGGSGGSAGWGRGSSGGGSAGW